MTDAQIIQDIAKKFGTQDISKWGILKWSWYDYVRLAPAGTNSVPFFVQPTGGVDPTSLLSKTYEITNTPQARGFGNTFFVLKSIGMHAKILPLTRQPAGISGDNDVIFTTYSDMMRMFYNLLGQGVLNVRFGQKLVFDVEQPFTMAPPRFGTKIHNHSVAAAQLGSIWVTQNISQKNGYEVTPSLVIEPDQTTDISLDFYNANTPVFTNLVNGASPAIDLGLWLNGFIVRPQA